MADAVPPYHLSPATESRPAGRQASWEKWAPLPDPVGYAGMFAGILDGRLVAGGGSQFRDLPLWLNGEKAFSDRVFVLAEPGGAWREHSQRMPRPLAHFAMATADGLIYLAGGRDDTGSTREVTAVHAMGERLVFEQLAEMPRALVYAAAATAAGRLYVAGGQPDPKVSAASAEVWSLALATGGRQVWRREPDLPGGGVFVGAMAADERAVYFIGGVSFDAAGKGVQLRKAYRLPLGARAWEELPELPQPRVGAVSPCPVLADGRIFVVGGYAAAFPGQPREDPGFARETYFFEVASRRWLSGPVLPRVSPTNRDASGDPGPAPMVAAPGVIWKGHVVVVSGEVRTSVRTSAVVAWKIPDATQPMRGDGR